MSERSRAAVAIGVWRARHVRTPGDHAYLVYAILMGALVAVVPVARAVWLSATSAAGVAVLASPSAAGVTAIIVGALWAGALLLGRQRGPALLPPFLTHVFGSSDLSRSRTFRGPTLRSGAIVTVLTTVVAGLIGGSLASLGMTDPLGAVAFTAVGALVGVIATVAWLAGEAFPRAAAALAIVLLALGAITAVVPALTMLTPWGWVALAYPGGSSSHVLASPVALSALTAAITAAAPALMNRLGFAELMAQSAHWDAAAKHATTMDFGAATTIYRGRPHVGRRVRAVRATGGLPLTFLIRDAIGASRTPGRLVVGILAIAGAGVLITFAFLPTTPGWLLGAAAGLLAFAGLGPLTDGIRHAASVASDLPLYGISDERLLFAHALLPLVVSAIVLLAAVTACTIALGIAAAAPIGAVLALGILAVGGRIGDALKGALPPVLLTPIPTAMGDLGALVRMGWALDAVLLAALTGASVTLLVGSPVLLVGMAAVIVGICVSRWRHRS